MCFSELLYSHSNKTKLSITQNVVTQIGKTQSKKLLITLVYLLKIFYRKENSMTEKEKAILERLKKVMPTLPQEQQMYILGYGEAIADMARKQEELEPVGV